MTNPGGRQKQYVCIDPGTYWGMFFEKDFQKLLDHGYLDEGSLWLQKNTGIVHEVVGKQAPWWLTDDTCLPQRLEEIND